MDYRKKLIAAPGSKPKLKHVDPGWTGKHASEADAAVEVAKTLAKITRHQELLYGERKHALLIVLQGIDAAGKDGTCWHVLSAMNPQGATVTSFKQPTAEDLAHDFLWRVHPHAPGLGQVAVFNRSHYEDVLVVRVHDLVPKSVWSSRYEMINAFEHLLASSGVTILKFFLYISPGEQLERFRQRLDDPARQWKISDADYTERARWDDYVRAYEDMLARCSTEHAPWFVIPSNHKWFRDLAVAQIVGATLEDLHMKPPKPTVDLDQIRADYHAAAAAQAKGGKSKKRATAAAEPA